MVQIPETKYYFKERDRDWNIIEIHIFIQLLWLGGDSSIDWLTSGSLTFFSLGDIYVKKILPEDDAFGDGGGVFNKKSTIAFSR